MKKVIIFGVVGLLFVLLVAAAGFWLFGVKGLAIVVVMVLSVWLAEIWPISYVLSHKGVRGAALVSFVALFVLALFGYWVDGGSGACVGIVFVLYYWLHLIDARRSSNA